MKKGMPNVKVQMNLRQCQMANPKSQKLFINWILTFDAYALQLAFEL
jgi:hypothetical protein